MATETTDNVISALADQQRRVVFSNDADFIQSLLLQGITKQLLVIATGNIRNLELAQLLLQALPSLKGLLQPTTSSNFIAPP